MGQNGFSHRLKEIFAKKCEVYIAEGRFDVAEIPENTEELLDLIEGPNARFLPFGRMDGGGNNITWTAKTYELDTGSVTLYYEVTGNMTSMTVNPDMVDFVSTMGDKEYSFLQIPIGENHIFYALNGVDVSHEGNLVIADGDNPSKINFKAFRKCNKLTDAILFKELIA